MEFWIAIVPFPLAFIALFAAARVFIDAFNK
jgi:hypothetical protein